MNPIPVFQTIEENTDKYISFLRDICSYETVAYDKEEMDRLIDYIDRFACAEGFSTFRTPFETCGDFLTIELNPGAEKAGVLMAHLDVVQAKGSFGSPAVKIEGNRMIGPGTVDCKGGAAMALLIMKALKENGYPHHVRLILTTDEEISNILGGEKEQQFFRDQTLGFPFALNCEVTENNDVAVSRKGILRYRLTILGKGGHSGLHYFDCKNAILEAAHKIIALESASCPDQTTYSCNVIHAGSAANAIPDECQFTVDIRTATTEDLMKAEQFLLDVAAKSFIGETTTTPTRLSMRPPFERREDTMALFRRMNDLSHRFDLGDLVPTEPGGGSDSAYTQAAGITSICGVGPSGANYHTNRESVELDSIPRRAKLLAALLCDH